MALRIISATEPISVETIILMTYAVPGWGKTSLAFTAGEPLLLDFDRGAHRSAYRRDSVPVESWADVAQMSEDDLAPYDTIIVDTVGRALDVITADIIRDNPKMGRKDGALTLQGYGALKGRFAQWMRRLRSFGKDVILLAHANEQRDGDDLIFRPDITGGSYAEVFKVADGVAFGYVTDQGKRMLDWNPGERHVGKNPAELDPHPVPHLTQEPRYMAGLAAMIKGRIGALSEAAQEIVATVNEWRQRVEDATDADAVNALVESAKTDLDGPAQIQVKVLIAERAKVLDLKWEGTKAKGAFVPTGAEEAA